MSHLAGQRRSFAHPPRSLGSRLPASRCRSPFCSSTSLCAVIVKLHDIRYAVWQRGMVDALSQARWAEMMEIPVSSIEQLMHFPFALLIGAWNVNSHALQVYDSPVVLPNSWLKFPNTSILLRLLMDRIGGQNGTAPLPRLLWAPPAPKPSYYRPVLSSTIGSTHGDYRPAGFTRLRCCFPLRKPPLSFRNYYFSCKTELVSCR